MDAYVQEILTDWGLQEYTDIFKENDIDETAFNLLNDDCISKLFQKMGAQLKFKEKYKSYIQRKKYIDHTENYQYIDIVNNVDIDSSALSTCSTLTASSAPSTPSTPSTSSSPFPSGDCETPIFREISNINFPVNEAKLKALINNEENTKEIIFSLKNLSRFSRDKLTDYIIANEIKNNIDYRITTTRFKYLAEEICAAIPGELTETYYIPYRKDANNKPISARGKLFDKYIRKRKVLKQIGIINKKETKNVKENAIELNSEFSEAEINEAAAWLKHNIEPWPEVETNWKKTYIYRKNNYSTISEYFQIYRCLQQPMGYTLLNVDFEHAYPDKINIFYSEWPQRAISILKLAEIKRKSDNILDKFLKDIEFTESNEDTNHLKALLILPLLMQTSNVKSKKSGKHWRPSRFEIQKGFLLHVESLDKFLSECEIRKTKLQRLNITDQPYPTIIGPSLNQINGSYFSVNNIKYKVESPLKAFDCCFKAYHAFNAEYPIEAEHVWVFIQQAVYGIFTQYDKKYISVTTLMSDLATLY